MTEEKIKEYSNKYRNTSKKLGIILTVFMLTLAVLMIIIGFILVLNDQSLVIVIISSIMALAAILDGFLAIRFYIFTKERLKRISDLEAATRYAKIHGYKN